MDLLTLIPRSLGQSGGLSSGLMHTIKHFRYPSWKNSQSLRLSYHLDSSIEHCTDIKEMGLINKALFEMVDSLENANILNLSCRDYFDWQVRQDLLKFISALLTKVRFLEHEVNSN